jgi:hypothetical protein
MVLPPLALPLLHHAGGGVPECGGPSAWHCGELRVAVLRGHHGQREEPRLATVHAHSQRERETWSLRDANRHTGSDETTRVHCYLFPPLPPRLPPLLPLPSSPPAPSSPPLHRENKAFHICEPVLSQKGGVVRFPAFQMYRGTSPAPDDAPDKCNGYTSAPVGLNWYTGTHAKRQKRKQSKKKKGGGRGGRRRSVCACAYVFVCLCVVCLGL